MVPANSDRIPRVPPYSGYCYRKTNLPVRAFHPLWSNFPDRSSSLSLEYRSPITPALPLLYRFGLLPVRSPLLRKSMFLSFPPPTKMFQFRGLASLRMSGLLPDGLSHSEISGSNLVCKSPELIAAYHVFLRLQEPRHSPYALYYFLTTPYTYQYV